MKNKFTHIPLLIFATVMLLMVISLYGYMYQATGASVGRAGTAVDFVISEQSNASKAKMISSLASSTQTDRDRLNSFFVSSDNMVSLITAIEAFGPASGSKLSITSINADPLTNAAPGTIGHARVHIDAHGSWRSVMRLLDLVEEMQYVASVSHVKIDNSSPDSKATGNWNLSFDLQVLTIVPPVSVSTVI